MLDGVFIVALSLFATCSPRRLRTLSRDGRCYETTFVSPHCAPRPICKAAGGLGSSRSSGADLASLPSAVQGLAHRNVGHCKPRPEYPQLGSFFSALTGSRLCGGSQSDRRLSLGEWTR